jgi:hypothetical protein
MLAFYKSKIVLLKKAARTSLFLAYFYIFFEWLYSLSKSSSSFMYLLGWGRRIEVLFVSGLAFTLLAFLLIFVLSLIAYLLSIIFHKIKTDFLFFIPSALMIACVSLIAFDNFTYTVWKFGIVTTTSFLRVLYAVAFLGIFGLVLRWLAKQTSANQPKIEKLKQIPALILLSVSVLFVVYAFFTQNIDLKNETPAAQKAESTPNVIFLSTDGLNAKEMSVYGYTRETTPFLDEISSTLLVSENNFTNVGHTTGSIVSMLTGKSAFETKVLFPPDILRGSDTFEQLPSILRSAGYTNVQIGVPYYVDANSQNFQNAFDSVNCSDSSNLRFQVNKLTAFKFDDEVYLLADAQERISERLLHVFYIKNMVNPSKVVNQMSKFAATDVDRMNCLITSLKMAQDSGTPVFAQMHLMVTHGPYFYPYIKTYSANEKQTTSWMQDFNDDAVLDFDNDIKTLVTYLKESGQYDNTILVIYSDHGQHWTTYRKTPMIIHFPSDQYAGTLSTNTQNIDVAPTILDYIGLEKPSWMEGDSMIGNLAKNRILISSNTDRQAGSETGLVAVPEKNISAPFYQFSELQAVQCQNIYRFDFDKLTITSGIVENYTNPCPAEDLDSIETIKAFAIKTLQSYGYDVPENWDYNK